MFSVIQWNSDVSHTSVPQRQNVWNFNFSHWLDCNPLYIISIYTYIIAQESIISDQYIWFFLGMGEKKSIQIRGSVMTSISCLSLCVYEFKQLFEI